MRGVAKQRTVDGVKIRHAVCPRSCWVLCVLCFFCCANVCVKFVWGVEIVVALHFGIWVSLLFSSISYFRLFLMFYFTFFRITLLHARVCMVRFLHLFALSGCVLFSWSCCWNGSIHIVAVFKFHHYKLKNKLVNNRCLCVVTETIEHRMFILNAASWFWVTLVRRSLLLHSVEEHLQLWTLLFRCHFRVGRWSSTLLHTLNA